MTDPARKDIVASGRAESDAGLEAGREGRLATRREFVKRAAAAVGAAAVGLSASARAHKYAPAGHEHPPTETQYGMVIDVRRCIGCQACSIACKAEFDVPLGATRGWVEYVEKGDYPNVKKTFLARLCNHCSHPPCVEVCPTGATYKRNEDGIVVVDSGICIGCKYCIQACPYDARFLNPVTRTADKCDFCIHRTSQGLMPACVEACVGRARIFGDIHDPESEVAKVLMTNAVTVLRPGQGTTPNVYYIEADLSDEHDYEVHDRYVRVTTHRKYKERR